jgi:hypothetical protein
VAAISTDQGGPGDPQDFCERYADGPVLVLGTHFQRPTAGHIVSHGAAWRFRPAED